VTICLSDLHILEGFLDSQEDIQDLQVHLALLDLMDLLHLGILAHPDNLLTMDHQVPLDWVRDPRWCPFLKGKRLAYPWVHLEGQKDQLGLLINNLKDLNLLKRRKS